MSTADFQRLVNRFQGTMRDYHVMIHFQRTESSMLPISVRGAEGRMDAFKFLLPVVQKISDKLERAAVASDKPSRTKSCAGLPITV